MTAPEFPILGTEPIAVEFANTRYGTEPVDFLRTARLVDQWFAAAGGWHGLVATARHTAAQARLARALRDHVHDLFTAAATGQVPAPAAVAGVNEYVAACPPALILDWAPDGTRRAHFAGAATGVDGVLARIATNAVEVLTTPGAGTLARCTGPGCSLLFLRTHARRRFCHPSCGHRDRQARYYHRHRSHR